MAISTFPATAQDQYLLVGAYTNTGSKGIYVYLFDAHTGETELVSTMGNITNPSFLTVSGNNVYAVSETHGDNPGSVYAYTFDRQEGKLHFLNQQPTGGDDPCHVSVDNSGNLVAVGNYSGGNLALYSTNDEGALSERVQLIQHEGSSVNKARQEKPHVHEVVFSPSDTYLFTPDLGTDEVVIYEVNKEAKQPLTRKGEIQLEPGAGPRHMTFHPSGKFAYVIQELSGMVNAYQYADGKFTKIQEISALPEDFSGTKDGAEIMTSPDGKFLYTSQRGDDNAITIFRIDDRSGKLQKIGRQPVMGKGPRHFTIDPEGKYLIVANQQSDNIVIFKRNNETGLLEFSGNKIKVPVPVCVQWVE